MTPLLFDFGRTPESINNMYISRGNRRVLSAAGKSYVNSFVTRHGGLSTTQLLTFTPYHDAAYELSLWFFLSEERLFNETFGVNKRVKSPFRDIDTSNMIKLAEDSIAKLLGIRDRNNWTVCAHKRVAEKGERTVARLQLLNLKEDPYPCPLP